MKTNWKDWGKTVGVFTLAGPPIGWISMCVCATAMGILTGTTTAREIGTMFGGMIFGSVFSYLFGGVPALITGAFVGLFRHRLTSSLSWLSCGVLGLFFTAVFMLTFEFDGLGNIGLKSVFNPLTYMGGFAAVVCAWLMRPKNIALPPPLPAAPLLKDNDET